MILPIIYDYVYASSVETYYVFQIICNRGIGISDMVFFNAISALTFFNAISALLRISYSTHILVIIINMNAWFATICKWGSNIVICFFLLQSKL